MESGFTPLGARVQRIFNRASLSVMVVTLV